MKKCFCNGSRGTDCDWCQGTGFIKEPVKIAGILKNAKSPDAKKQFLKRKEFIITRNGAIEVKPVKKPSYSTRSYFDQQIKRINRDINDNSKTIPIDSIHYLCGKIKKLENRLNKVKTEITYKQRQHYMRLKRELKQLKVRFDSKFGNRLKGI